MHLFDPEDPETDMFIFLVGAMRYVIERQPIIGQTPVRFTHDEGGEEAVSTISEMLDAIEAYLELDVDEVSH